MAGSGSPPALKRNRVIDNFLGGLAEDFAWLDVGNLKIVHEETGERAANWKILVEGGIESYHFRIAHRDTIGPLVQDNLSSYRVFGRQIRSILTRARLDAMTAQPKERWSLRSVTNLVYTVFPSAQLLVQKDHVVWIQGVPLAPDRILVRIATLAPSDFDPANAEAVLHWRKKPRHHRPYPGGGFRDRREHPERPVVRR